MIPSPVYLELLTQESYYVYKKTHILNNNR